MVERSGFCHSVLRCGRRFFNRRDGTSSVEFVLVLPVLSLFLFGIIQFGSILYLQSNMANAAREAA